MRRGTFYLWKEMVKGKTTDWPLRIYRKEEPCLVSLPER